MLASRTEPSAVPVSQNTGTMPALGGPGNPQGFDPGGDYLVGGGLYWSTATPVPAVAVSVSPSADGVNFQVQAATPQGTYSINVHARPGSMFYNSPENLTALFSLLPPPFLAAASKLAEGITFTGNPGGALGL